MHQCMLRLLKGLPCHWFRHIFFSFLYSLSFLLLFFNFLLFLSSSSFLPLLVPDMKCEMNVQIASNLLWLQSSQVDIYWIKNLSASLTVCRPVIVSSPSNDLSLVTIWHWLTDSFLTQHFSVPIQVQKVQQTGFFGWKLVTCHTTDNWKPLYFCLRPYAVILTLMLTTFVAHDCSC